MQTTLLGLGIAIILALITALVGPLFVDWNNYRAQFEAEASRLVGVPVRVSGPIDLRILPSPTLVLSGIEIGAPGTANAVKARALGVEFALGPLMRGQLRAAQTRLVGPEITVGLDPEGGAIFPRLASRLGFESIAIDRLNIDEARITLADAASRARATLERFWFHGEVRSLAGAFKGDGAFILNGNLYGYRVATSRLEDGSIKIKFGVDPADRPLNAEGEGAIAFENGQPRFEGVITVARAPGVALAGGETVANQPLRLSARVKATASSALLEGIEFQYGPDERSVKLSGTAEMKFGAGPRLDGVLSARQLDLDRLAATGDATPGTPFSILASLKDSFAPNLRPSWPVKIGIGIDNVTLGGAMLQSLRGDLRSDKTGWSLDHIEFRAPGQTQVQLAGKVGGDMSFSGSVDMTSGDPRALLAWLDGRSDLPIAALRPVRLRGNVTLGAEAVTIEAMQAEIDRRAVEGSAGYRFASGGRKARVEAQLRAPDLNADELIEFARAMFVDRNLERPGEIALAVDFGGMALAGIDAKGVRARLKYDDQGLRVEQLAIADFGGVGLGGNGSIETGDTGPRGSLVLDVEARAWAGIDALAAKFAPQLADDVRLITQRLGAAKLHASLDVDKDAAPNGSALARMTLDGQVGALRVNFRAEGRGDPAAPGSARIRVDADASADDGAALLQAFGLDALLRGQAGPGEAKLQIAGPADGELNVSARLAVGDLHAESHGTARAGRDGGFRLASGLMVTKGDGRTLPLPFTLQSRLAVADGTATLSDVSAILPDSRMRGQLSIRLGRPLDVSGRFETDMLDAPSIVGTAIGLPPSSPDGAWSTDPFARTNLPDLNARLEFKAAQVVLGGGMRASDMSGVLRLSSSEIGLEDIHGQVAGGRLSGTASFRRSGDVVNTQLHFALKDADAAVLTGREGAPVSGRLDTQAEVEGYGLTPKALAGSLNGNGTVSLRQAGIGKLDPRAFAVAMRAVDQGMPLDAAKLRDVVGPALEAGRLGVKDLEGVINIVNGQARLGTVIAHGDGADLAVSGNLDLVTQALDARLVLTAADAVTTAGRPELTVTLKGPLSAPRRTTDVSTLTGWLALRAVEQQSKRLEQIEAERSGRMPPLSVSSSSASAAPAAGPGQKAAPLPPPINIKPAPKPAPAPRASGLSEHDRYLDPFNSQR